AVPDRRGARGAQAGGGGAAARRSPRAPGEGGGGEAVTTPRRAAGADPFGGRWTRRGHRGPCHRGPHGPGADVATLLEGARGPGRDRATAPAPPLTPRPGGCAGPRRSGAGARRVRAPHPAGPVDPRPVGRRVVAPQRRLPARPQQTHDVGPGADDLLERISGGPGGTWQYDADGA